MGKEPAGVSADDEVIDIDEAMEALQRKERWVPPAPAITEADIESAGFVLPDEENLAHLAPGCFVLIQKDGVYCWTEIASVDGDRIGGRLHNELSSTTCLVKHHTSEIAYFRRDQIRALGCERYCWC